jgi:hypothetical protein
MSGVLGGGRSEEGLYAYASTFSIGRTDISSLPWPAFWILDSCNALDEGDKGQKNVVTWRKHAHQAKVLVRSRKEEHSIV